MIRFIRPLILKTTIIVLTLKYFSVISANTGSQKTPEKLPAEIYKSFKINNVAAALVESTILVSWNIEENKKRENKPNRTLTIFENDEMGHETSITIEDFCKVNGVPSTTCAYPYPKVDCLNYKFTLGNRNNVAYITTVQVKKHTTTFELTNNEPNPVKLTWKIECNATSMYPVPISSMANNGKRVDDAVKAGCKEQQICEINLNRTVVCTTSNIYINGETILLSPTTYLMSNLSIEVSNLNQIGIGWVETEQIKCPVSSSQFNYSLVIKDNEKNQIVQNLSVPNWCVIDNSPHNSKTRRRKLTFSRKGHIASCQNRNYDLVFNNELRPCVNYSVSIFRSGDVNITNINQNSYDASNWSNMLMMTFLGGDIQNLRVARLSSSRLELQWEISAACKKVENFIMSIEKNYELVENVSLSSKNTQCNDTTCTLSWIHDQTLTECTQNVIHVSRSTIYVTIPPPGAASFIVDSSNRNNSSNFEVEWKNFPRTCQGNLTIQKPDELIGTSSFIGTAPPIITGKCSSKYCHTRWRFDIKLDPCTSYKLDFGSFTNEMTTLPEIQNLHVASLSSIRIELQWEISAACKKVENFIISIKKNYNLVENVSLPSKNTQCNDTTCTVSWIYDQNLTECTKYVIHVSGYTINVTTPPPGSASFIVDSSKSNMPSNFEVEWTNLPRQCQGNLTIQKVVDWNRNSSFIGSAPAIPSRECHYYCHTRWRFDKELEPCTTYKLNLGLFAQEITTLPDFSGGIVNNMTIRSRIDPIEVPESPDEPATLVISWDHPHCQKTKDLQWKISIKKSLSNTTIVKPISNLGNSFKYAGVKACETYIFAILTVFENGSTLYSTEEKNFQADCSTVKLLVPISVIAGLLLIAITIALFLCRKRKKMDALEKESEHNVNKRTSIESRDRAPSMNHSKFPSFNHNRISCASRNSCNSRNSSSEYAEMDLDYLPQMTKRPLNIRDICSFDVGQARMEFFLINKLAEKETKRLPRTIAERPENKMKNRFLNTHPYDFNRVLLSHSGDDQNDGYINASFIPGFAEKEKEYIAAQGPKDNTLVDFWQMILEQDVRLIAMVTSLYECGKKKCEKYWPGEDELVIYGGDTQLELLQETTYSFYTIRNILVTKAPDLKREIQQFHFTAWPDFETPDQPEELIRFIEIVRRQARQLNLSSPIVVHCSAGVGRTGTFIALDYLIQQVLITDLVDIPRTVRHLRRLRLSMVQSEAQYVFLYSCIAHYVKTRLSAESG